MQAVRDAYLDSTKSNDVAQQSSNDQSNIYKGIATGFNRAAIAADSTATLAPVAAVGSGGDKAVAGGLEGVTKRIISRPLAVAEGIANTASDIHNGAAPADAIVGNVVRSALVYGGSAGAGALGGGWTAIPTGIFLDHVLPNGATIGHGVLHPTRPSVRDPYFDPSFFQGY